MPDPAYRLVPRPSVVSAAPMLDAAQRRVVDHAGGPLLVLAGPGTGKTTTLVEAAVERVRRGAPVESLLLLTFGRRAAGQLRDRVTARLGGTVREPVARTVHSYAFGILRMAAATDGAAPPRLLSGAEQDVLLRELVRGDVADAITRWPDHLRPALDTRGFVDELRDLLLRAAERGLDGPGLARLGQRHARTDWEAVGGFWHRYTEVTALARQHGSGRAYDAAELVRAAIDTLAADPALLGRERARRRHIFVDEYQDTDPAQAELLSLLAAGADELILVGDPDQSIYAFRGADEYALSEAHDRFGPNGRLPTIELTTSRRAGTGLLAATRRIAGRLPGPAAHRRLVAEDGVPAGRVDVRLLRTASEEAATVATVLRRAHLDDRIPWRRMAVLVRSTVISLATLRRALVTAGVPVAMVGEDTPLAEQSAVNHLLVALRCAAHPGQMTDDDVTLLLLGPTGNADGLYLRRLRRDLRALAVAAGEDVSAADGGPGTDIAGAEISVGERLLVSVVSEPDATAALPARLRGPVARVARVLAAGHAAAQDGAAEDVLWAVWEATGLEGVWARASAAGGPVGAAADRDLDAVIELFDAAARLADRLPGATVDALVEHVAAQQLPSDTERGRPESDEAVRILTAHASKGLEWDVVCVAGVQEGVWPSLRRRGSLLGSETLVDLRAGRGEVAGHSLAPQLAEERRLFYVAVTRARRRLLVTAVSGDEEQPSRFLDELDPVEGERPVHSPPRGLHLSGLVAELRRAVVDPAVEASTRTAAATQLARLAAAGVPGADPVDWWGLTALSDERGLVDPDQTAWISPSRIESYLTCAMKTLLEAAGGREDDGPQASLGSAVHEVAEVAAPGADLDELARLLDERWPALDFGAAWYARAKRMQAEAMLQRMSDWLRTSRASLDLVAVERAFRVPLGDPGTGPVAMSGTVDRLERDRDGRLVVVDFKTGATKVGKDDVAVHPQLAAYQLAVAAGAFADAEADDPVAGTVPGGARLVQLGARGEIEQTQASLGPGEDRELIQRTVAHVAGLTRGARFDPVVNSRCAKCPVRRCCPLQDGRQVTE